MILEGKDTDFDIWCQEKCDEYCKRSFFFFAKSQFSGFRLFILFWESKNQILCHFRFKGPIEVCILSSQSFSNSDSVY